MKNNIQDQADTIAALASAVFGARVVPKGHFDQLNAQNEALVKKISDYQELQIQVVKSECKAQGFMDYHRKWKPMTRGVQKRGERLKKEKLIIEFEEFPDVIKENLKEAYACYLNGLQMASYLMILRTLELTVGMLYDAANPKGIRPSGKQEFISASVKLNWVNSKGLIKGTSYTFAKGIIEARNEAIHDLYVPDDLELLSTFKKVIELCKKLVK